MGARRLTWANASELRIAESTVTHRARGWSPNKLALPMANRMLIVDDDGLVRAFLKDCLQSLGHEVAEAKDGEEALEQLQMQPFELLFLDLLMPRMSGLDVLGRVRDLHPDCRVVVVSSLDSDSLVEQALGAGASGFITKPFHPVEVKSAVVQALRAQSEAK